MSWFKKKRAVDEPAEEDSTDKLNGETNPGTAGGGEKIITGGQSVNDEDDPASWPIDDGVWYKLSREWVTNADSRLQTQADGITGAVKWFFGLGSSAAVIGTFLDKTNIALINPWLAIVVICAMLLAYTLATIATTTISRTLLTPNVASTILAAFNDSNRIARKYILWASISLLIGMLLVGPALVNPWRQKPPADIQVNGFYTTMLVNKKKILDELHLSIRGLKGNFFSVRLDSGKTIAQSVAFSSFDQQTQDGRSDLIWSLASKGQISQPASNIYVTVYYLTEKDTTSARTIRILSPK